MDSRKSKQTSVAFIGHDRFHCTSAIELQADTRKPETQKSIILCILGCAMDLLSVFVVVGSVFLAVGSVFVAIGSVFAVVGCLFVAVGSAFVHVGSVVVAVGSVLLVVGSVFLAVGSVFLDLCFWLVSPFIPACVT